MTRLMALALPALIAGCVTVDSAPEESEARVAVARAIGMSAGDAAGAETIDPDAGLSLELAVRRAVAMHPGIEAAFREIGVAKAEWVRSGLPANPILDLALFFPSGGGSAGVEGGIAWEILDLWRIPRRRDVAAHDLRAAIYRVADLAASRARETRARYYEALAAAEELAIREAEAAVYERARGQVETRRGAGRATEWEASVADVDRLRAELESIEARRKLRTTRNALAERIAWTVDPAVALTTPLPPPWEGPLDEDRLVAGARDARLDLVMHREEETAAHARAVLAGSSWWSRASIGVVGERAERPAGESERGPSRFGPSLSVPLPVFDRSEASAAAERLRFERASLLRAEAELVVERQVRDAVAAVEATRAAERILREELLPAARRRLDVVRVSYATGSGPATAVLQAELDVLRSRRAHLAARLETAIAHAGLEAAIGRPIDVAPTEP